MRRMPTHCPSCNSPMHITELTCSVCETTVRGRYTGCPICELSDENVRFVQLFVTCRGNIKEMERETGLGYWTIRSRLDEVVEALQAQSAGTPEPSIITRRRDILAAVERGDLSIEAAEQALRELKRS
ncbi:MAG: DUF2089 domain-containing protein [Anaerolineae bacterium]|nr:DUF2089 domain-containing protein [Anaerolineae bacterium]